MTPVVPHVVFRVDAGPGIGLGHLNRCLALAASLAHRGAACVFLAQETRFAHDRIEAAGLPLEILDLAGTPAGGDADLAQTTDVAATNGAVAVVVDSYAASASFLGSLRRAGFRVIFIDDLARESVPAHLVVNGGAQAHRLPYQSATGDTQFLLGPAYAMLPQGFRDLPPRQMGSEVRRVLITVGGDDVSNVTAELIERLDRTAGDFDVQAVVGPFARAGDHVREACRRSRRPAAVVRGATDLRELMLHADVAISAAGQTLYELAAAGTPTLAFELADNQAESLRSLDEAGVVKSAGRLADSGFYDRLLVQFHALVLDVEARAGLSTAGQRLVDGRGAERVAAAILAG